MSENDKIFYRMPLIQMVTAFVGLKNTKSETTLQSGNLENAPAARLLVGEKSAPIAMTCREHDIYF